MMQFLLPLNEIVVDFHDHLKSISSGYASFDYEECGFVPSKLVKVSSFMNPFNIRDRISTISKYWEDSTFNYIFCNK
jgi:translation elongation factor EF-4